MSKIQPNLNYRVFKILRTLFILITLLCSFECSVRTNNQISGAEAKITSFSDIKYQSFLDKNLDFFITKYDYLHPEQSVFRYSEVRSYLKRDKEKVQEGRPDLFVFPNELIEEEEEKFKKEILNNVIKKEVNVDDYKLNENSEIFGFPDNKIYEVHPVRLLKNSATKIRSFNDFPHKITFEPKSLEIVDKPICIPAMFFLNLKNSKNEQIVLNNIRTDLYQVTIFFFRGKEGTVFNQKNLYPKVVNQGESLILQIVFLPDIVGEIKGNLYFEFSDNKIVVFPIRIRGVENIYKVEPIYFNYWLSSKLLTHKLNIFNPHNKVLIIKEVINSFSSINLNWPNGSPVSSNSTAIDISMLEIPPKTNQTLLHINFYKEVSGIEYGLLQIKTDKDNLIVPVLIRVEIVGLKAYPSFYNFGVIDLNFRHKRLIPVNLENVSKQNILVKRVFSSFDEHFVEVIPIKKSKNNHFVVKPEESLNEFAYLMFDPSNYVPDLHENFLYKKTHGQIIIQTNFTENPFVYLNYEYYLDKNTFSYPPRYFDFYYSRKQDTSVTTYESNFKINSSLNFVIQDIITDSPFIKIDFDRKVFSPLQGNYMEKNIKLELKIDNQNNFFNKKFYYICIKNVNHFGIIPIKLYDKSLDFNYYNETMQENTKKGINIISQKLILDLGTISSVEMNKRLYNITNDNPEEIIIVDIEYVGATVNLEYITYLNKYGFEENVARIHRQLKKPNEKKELNLSIPGNSIVSLSFHISSPSDQDMTSMIKFQFDRKITFQLTLKFKILRGNLNITPSMIRFEPAFPGLFQHKIISSKSSYNLPVSIESVSSKDPRIQPVLLTNTIISNNRTEIMKVIFDPSKVPIEDNFMKGEFYVNTTSKYVSYKELYLWKEKQKLWETLGSQGKSEINAHVNIQTNIQSEKVNVRAFLTKPSLVKKDEIDFGLIHIGESVKTDIEIFNPSDEPVSIQIILAPEEYSDIHNNSMFIKNRKFRFTPSNGIVLMDCFFYNSTSDTYIYTNTTLKKRKQKKQKTSKDQKYTFENLYNSIIIEEDITMFTIKNHTKNDLLKKLFLFANNNVKTLMVSSDKFICSPRFIKKNEIITNNYRELMDLIFSEEFNKDINIIKKMTDANPPNQNKHFDKYQMNFIEKIGYYLKLFFKIENSLKFRRKVKHKRRQEIFIPKTITNNVYIIKPHQKLKIGPIYYHPKNSSNYTATLFIKNNLTILYPLRIKGMGGSGLLEFYANEINSTSKNASSTLRKIEKLVINIDSQQVLNQLDNDGERIFKTVKLKNSGNLPLKIYNISIENMGCHAHGISISKCSEINLKPQESINLEFAINPNFNFYLLEKNIVFHTHYQKIQLKLSVNISDEILAIKNRLFNPNFGGLTFLVIVSIIAMILYILSKEYSEVNLSASKKSIIFISPKEIIEKNPILKIENLLLKTYRRINKKIDDELNLKQYTTNYSNPIENEKKKSISSATGEKISRKERKITEDSSEIKKEISQPTIGENNETKEIVEESKTSVKESQNQSQVTASQQKKKQPISTTVPVNKKQTKPVVDKTKPKPVGLKADKNEKTTPVEVKQEPKQNIEYVVTNNQTSQPGGYSGNQTGGYYNQTTGYYQQEQSVYNNANTGYNRNNTYQQFNKFNSYNKPYHQRGQNSGSQDYSNNTGYSAYNQSNQNQNNLVASTNEKTPSDALEKEKLKAQENEINKIEEKNQERENPDKNIEEKSPNLDQTRKISEEKSSEVKESDSHKLEAPSATKTEAEIMREQFNNMLMGFKLGGGDNTTSDNINLAAGGFSNPKTVISQKLGNEEGNISSQMEVSENDDDKNMKQLGLDDDNSVHYQSEKQWEESGTEDKREDIKLNFNSIFGYHSNVKIITNENEEKDQAEENAEKDDNTLGGLYFNEKFFTNFDKVFKKPDPFGFNSVVSTNNNPFVSDNNKVSTLNELRDDDDEKFRLDDLNDDKPDNKDELENDDEDEKDPEWGDDDVDIKKEGFFDETGTYKLKQIDFNFDFDMKKIKR